MVGEAPSLWTANDGGDILRADSEAGDDGAEAETQVNERGKNGERDANGQITDKSKKNSGKELGERAGAGTSDVGVSWGIGRSGA